MTQNRKIAIVVGILFLLGYVAVFGGGAVYGPFVDAPDYLSMVYPNKAQVIMGMLIEVLNDVAVVGIAVLLFPFLRKYSESLALGYVGLRVIEAVILVVSKINVLSLIELSQEYLAAGSPADSYFQTAGVVALGARYWASQMQTIFFMLGALVFYYLLYQTRLLPRFISIWGFIAVASLIAANVLPIPDLTEGFSPAQLLFMPIFLSELLVAGWLIVKGFNEEAIEPERATQASPKFA